MPFIDRREFLKIVGVSAAATTVPGLVACGKGELLTRRARHYQIRVGKVIATCDESHHHAIRLIVGANFTEDSQASDTAIRVNVQSDVCPNLIAPRIQVVV